MFSSLAKKHYPWFLDEGIGANLSLTLIPPPCTRLKVLVSTFSSLMRNLRLGSALLPEACGAASHLCLPLTRDGVSSGVDRSIAGSLFLSGSSICLCSRSLTSSMCFEKGENLMLWLWWLPDPDWQGPAVQALQVWHMFYGLQDHLVWAQKEKNKTT